MTDDFAAQFTHPRLVRFYAYWLAQAPTGKLPGRQHIDPLDIPDLLPWINLVDVAREDDALRYRHRLVGTAIVEYFGRDSTGRWYHEIYDDKTLEELYSVNAEVVRNRKPHYRDTMIPVSGRQFMRYERVICPLAGDGETVDMLAGVHVFPDREDGEAAPGPLGPSS